MIKHALLPASEFAARRAKLFAKLPASSLLVVRSGHEQTRSNDTEYHFCPDKNFFYLCGFQEPEAMLLLVKGDTEQTILCCREKDPLQEVWHGKRVGPEAAVSQYGVDDALTSNEGDDAIVDYLSQVKHLFVCFEDNELMAMAPEWLSQVAGERRIGKNPASNISDAAPLIHELRLIKSDAELDVMRQANELSGKAHQRAMLAASDGKFEYQVEAELLHEFAINGARFAAYNSIVAGGDNANILHYTDNNEQLKNGELLLIDAGGELAGYAADITRTFPVSGEFTTPQKAIYQLVLDSQLAAVEAIKPGQTLSALNDIVCKVLTEGLVSLGILQGDVEELVQNKACKQYFIHGLGHWLGLDVHDVGDYQSNEKRQQLRAFEPGMVMTIEPGLYIPMDADVDEQWRGIGVRIEDNIAVTEHGYENLTVNVPKSIDDIESLIAGRQN